MMFEVSKLRNSNQYSQFEGKKGYIKWWARKDELNIILDELDVKYEDIKEFLETKDDLYCIFIGQPKTQELPAYLKQEIILKSTRIVDGILYFRKSISSLKRSIYSIFLNNPSLGCKTREFLDKLFIEVIVIDNIGDVQNIRKETDPIVDDLFRKYFYIFNMDSKYHPEMEWIVNNLSSIRDNAKANAKKNSSKIDKLLKLGGGEVTLFKSNGNIIYFGAPGTGKSYNLNKDKDILLKDYPQNYERVTFHPDYSYANFVGTYKPVPEEESITYAYVPGPFMRILKKAINSPDEPFLLIIEEINRANVAAVFGDVFQLLDRKNDISRYDISASEEMKDHLIEKLEKTRKNSQDLINLLGENFDKIKIPQNMYIWATMNSADQGVFPMDTAFKRRWHFKYFDIDNDEDEIKGIKVNFKGHEIYWNDLRKAINNELLRNGINEDKFLGPFFAFHKYIDKELKDTDFIDIFSNKIIMYLFEDAARSKRNDLFSGVKGENNNKTYSQICDKFKNELGIRIFCDNIVNEVLKNEE